MAVSIQLDQGDKDMSGLQTAQRTTVDDRTTRRRVVIAEDEPLIRMDLAEMLTEEGFDVVGQAGDGDEAVALACELRPDVVILDVKMPRTDGITAAAGIAERYPAPVVMLSAFTDAELVGKAAQVGAMAYVSKPFTAASLLPALEVAMARHADAAKLRAEVADAAQRLHSRKVIDRAKGLLMSQQRMTEPQAFRWLQRTAMDRRVSMLLVATAVIDNAASTGTAENPARTTAVAVS
jgi:AmiR/NasT family two-component response regulator